MRYYYIFSSLITFVPFVIGLIKFRKLGGPLRLIFYLVAVGCLFNALMIYYGVVYRKNVWLEHIYTIMEFFFVATFYYRSFEQNVMKKIVTILMIIFTIVVVINKIYLEDFNKIDNYTLTINSILLLVVSSMFLVDYLSNSLIVELRNYRFIITVGFMIYFGGNLFIFALSNDIQGIWIVHNFISLMLTVVYTLVFIWQD